MRLGLTHDWLETGFLRDNSIAVRRLGKKPGFLDLGELRTLLVEQDWGSFKFARKTRQVLFPNLPNELPL